MARLARVVAVGEPHHLKQRGNNRQTTFLDDHDRRTYCRLLAEHSKRVGADGFVAVTAGTQTPL